MAKRILKADLIKQVEEEKKRASDYSNAHQVEKRKVADLQAQQDGKDATIKALRGQLFDIQGAIRSIAAVEYPSENFGMHIGGYHYSGGCNNDVPEPPTDRGQRALVYLHSLADEKIDYDQINQEQDNGILRRY